VRYAGIDVASEKHVVSIVDEESKVLVKATPFTEDAVGYKKLFDILGAPGEILVAM
jgi:transposase